MPNAICDIVHQNNPATVLARLWRNIARRARVPQSFKAAVFVVGALGIFILVVSPWSWAAVGRGWLRANLTEICNASVALAGALLTMSPTKVAEIESRVKNRRLLGGLLIILGVLGLVSGLKDKSDTTNQIRSLVTASTRQATTEDIRSIREDLQSLRKDTKNGFDSVVAAINSLGRELTGRSFIPAQKPKITEPPPETVKSQPPIIEHIRFTQRRTEAPAGGPPFAVQVIIQTDVSTQPTSLRIECDGAIDNGRFFVAGQPVMMNIRYGTSGNTFFLSFGYPAFSPENSVIVTLFSRTSIEVKKVERVSGS